MNLGERDKATNWQECHRKVSQRGFQPPQKPSMLYDLTHLPGAGNRLVVDSVPVLFANLLVVQIVTQDTVFVFGLLPPKEHRGVRVSDGQDRVRWSGNSWNGTKKRKNVN